MFCFSYILKLGAPVIRTCLSGTVRIVCRILIFEDGLRKIVGLVGFGRPKGGLLSHPDLVAALYNAAADPSQWNVALEAVCRSFNAPTGLLMIDEALAPAPRPIAVHNWSESALALYGSHYAGQDPYLAALRRKPAGSEVVLGQDVIDLGHFQNSLIWTDYSSKYVGAFHFLGASLAVAPKSPAGIGLHRPKDGTPFDESERVRLSQLTGHLEHALRLARKLDQGRSRLQTAALDSLRFGLVVVSREGRALYSNRAAEALDRNGRLGLGTRRSHIQAGSDEQNTQLLALIHSAASGNPGGDIQVKADTNTPLLAISVTPLPASLRATALLSTDGSRGMALMTVREVGLALAIPRSRLIGLFGLTNAEAEIVPSLLKGETANTIADRRRTSIVTVQTQIRQVLAKTGVPNLRALAALVVPLSD